MKDIEEIYRKKYKNHFKEYVNKFKDYGIISLTTNNDNLLMRSHYADEHKGIVIGFYIDENNPYLNLMIAIMKVNTDLY